MIDDMEDGDNAICKSAEREGAWSTVGDGSGGTLSPAQGAVFTMTPIPGGRGDSRMAARMTATGFTAWAQMGLNLYGPSGGAYDAGAHGGITFWMKTTASSVDVNLHISATVPVKDGGLCADSATTYNCYNSFTFGISSPQPDWFQYYVPYSALWQQGDNVDADGNLLVGSATWDPTTLTKISFTAIEPANVDLWIDDLSFYDCSGAACVSTCSDPTTMPCPALGTVPASCWPVGTDCSTVANLLWDTSFVSLWGSAVDDVWAVGFDLQGPSGAIVHWNGSAWSSFAAGGAGPLWGVWGSAPDDVWAVGDSGTVDHWNGTTWSAASMGTQANLNAVWGSGPNDVWAVGANGTILHYDGNWTTWPSVVTSKTLYRLWGTAQNDVWAVGDGGTILHYDGTTWSPSVSGTDSILFGVWASDPGNAYSVGNTATGEATVLQWNGTSWSPVSTMAAPYPNAVWGSGPDDVWIVGESIVHWDGSSWTTVPSPTSDYLNYVWGTGPTDIWSVGWGTILHGDGASWSAVPNAGIRR
jgi:hypothetical protein